MMSNGKVTQEQLVESLKLCSELPLIEDRLRRAGLFESAARMNKVIQKVGFETANQSERLKKQLEKAKK